MGNNGRQQGVGTSNPRLELPTPPKTAGRRPFIRRSKPHPLWVGTSDTGSELPNPIATAGISAQVSALCLSWVVSISIRHFGICKLSFHIPLNSTIFPILKVKIEIYKRSSMKLKHLLFSKYGVINCSFSF